MGKKGVIAATAATLSLAFAASADALVYWGNFSSSGSIGRADLDGTDPNQTFIEGANLPCSVAVDSQHVYWGNRGTSSIARADLNGDNVNFNFIPTTSQPCGVAVNSTHVFWTNSNGSTIGRADLDGSNPNQTFITGAVDPRGIAVNATHIYWANQDLNTIGRADLDGDPVVQNFITGANLPIAPALDATYVYWANAGDSTIGRAELDGMPADQEFIDDLSVNNPCGVAVDAGHVYWTNNNGSEIGSADIDGTNPGSFIEGATAPCGVAVSAAPVAPPDCSDDEATVANDQVLGFGVFCLGQMPVTYAIVDQPDNGQVDLSDTTGAGAYFPDEGFVGTDSFSWTATNIGGTSDVGTLTIDVVAPPDDPTAEEFTLGKAKRNKKRGTAKIVANVPGPGSLELSGKKVKSSNKEASSEGEVVLRVKPKGKAKQKLADAGKAKVKVEVAYTPEGGAESTQSTRIKLVKKLD